MFWTLQILYLVSLGVITHAHWPVDPLLLFAVDTANYSSNQYCRCDSACVKIGDCCQNCPGIMENLDEVSVKTRCVNVPNISRPVMVIYGCPDNYPDTSVMDNCSSTGFFESSKLYVDWNGLLYANEHCATCNAVTSGMYAMSKTPRVINHGLRFCQPSVEFCTIPGIKMWNRSLSDLCMRFSSPVTSTKDQNVVYKNVFCALCNGAPLERLTPFQDYFNNYLSNRPPPPPPSRKGKPQGRKDDKPGLLKMVRGVDEIPAAFSILLNFGLDGKEDMMFSSSNAEKLRRKQQGCGRDYIWDPFSEICRQLFCSVEYILVDFHCVANNNFAKEPERSGNLDIFDTEAQMAELRLSMVASSDDLLRYRDDKNGWDNIRGDTRKSLSKFYGISEDRVTNINLTTNVPDFDVPFSETLRVNGTSEDFIDDLEDLLDKLKDSNKVRFTASFNLHEPTSKEVSERPEPSVSKVVNRMVSSVATGTFYIHIDTIKAKVFAIHQNSTTLESWCSPQSGNKRAVYWNDEFHLVLHQNSSANDNWVKEIYINKTGETYVKGDFVANILFQGIEREDQKVNVSGFVIVCEKFTFNESTTPYESELNASCSRVLLKAGEYDILDDGTVEYYGKNSEYLDLTNYELAGNGSNGSILVCFDSNSIIKSMTEMTNFQINFDETQAIVSLVFLCLSITSLAIVLITYCLFPELLNLPGCNTLNLTLTLLGGQLTFLLSQRSAVKGDICAILGALVHYLILTSFLWMNVIAYDLYKTFGYGTVLSRIRPKRKYLPRYLAYAYLTPAIIVGFSLYLDTYENPIQPMYGVRNACWISNRFAALVLFAAPIGIVLLINLILYILTICSISDIHHKIETKTKPKNGKKDVWLYIRIAATMGFTWIFGFLAAFTRQWLGPRGKEVSETLVYLFIVFNCMQGVFVFVAFVCNKRVAALYRKAIVTLNNTTIAKCSRCGQTFCVCKAKVIMRRSSSTDTNMSVLSNDDLPGAQ